MTTFENSAQADWLQTELDELTSSPEDFPARTSASQEQEPVCPVSAAAFGPSFSELSLKHDRVGLSLRMYLGLELSEQIACSLTWQEQVTPLGRWWWVLSIPEPRTDDSGYGLLPTPNVPSGGRSIAHAEMKGATAYHNGKKVQVGLESLAKLGMLPTPSATTYGRNKGGQNPDGKERPSLESLAKPGMLPTPQARDRDQRGAQGKRYANPERSNDLPDAIAWHQEQGNGAGAARLSPCFVEWMMGYPAGYTDVSD